jgi:hypothetical protein
METKTVILKAVADTAAFPAVANGVIKFTVPVEMTGMNLVSVGLHVYTASDHATPINVQVSRARGPVDMLSTPITIDQNEFDSVDAATPAVINAANDDVVTGDVIALDVDFAGTNALGCEVRLGFQLPTA